MLIIIKDFKFQEIFHFYQIKILKLKIKLNKIVIINTSAKFSK